MIKEINRYSKYKILALGLFLVLNIVYNYSFTSSHSVNKQKINNLIALRSDSYRSSFANDELHRNNAANNIEYDDFFDVILFLDDDNQLARDNGSNKNDFNKAFFSALSYIFDYSIYSKINVPNHFLTNSAENASLSYLEPELFMRDCALLI